MIKKMMKILGVLAYCAVFLYVWVVFFIACGR